MDVPAPPPPHRPPGHAVRVLTRVVAAGVVTRGGKPYLRASLCFLPQPDPGPFPAADPAAGAPWIVDLERWPEDIEDKLNGGVKLHALPVTAQVGRISPASVSGVPSATWTRIGDNSDRINDIGELWRRLMAPTMSEIGADSRDVLDNYPGSYPDAAAAFRNPWSQLRQALIESISGKPLNKITVPGTDVRGSTPVPNVMSVPHGIAAKSIAALRIHAAIQTVYDDKRRRLPEREHAVFRPDLARGARTAATKLGRLAAGGNREATVSLAAEDWQGRAVSQARRRSVLVDAPGTGGKLRELIDRINTDSVPENNSNVTIALNIRRNFNRRHGGSSDDVPPPPHWLGQPRAAGEWLYSDIEKRMLETIKPLDGSRPTAKSLTDALRDIHIGRIGDALLHHAMAMRHVPHELPDDQNLAVYQAVQESLAELPPEKRTPEARRKFQNDEEDNWRKRNRIARGIVEAAGRRFFGLQSYPSLARLFNLVVDVEIDIESFYQPLGRNSVWGTLGWLECQEPGIDFDASKLGSDGRGPDVSDVPARYFLLAHSTSDRASDRAIWSTAKLREDGDGHFWPVTCEEIEAQRAKKLAPGGADQGIPPQYDGIVDLGFEREDHKPRFDLINLDIVQALEQYANASEAMQSGHDGGASLDRAGQGWGPLRTGGLAIIDTLRRDADVGNATTTIARRDSLKDRNAALLDANDLTVGYRVDVGVRPRGAGDDHRFVWRSLMTRLVTYEDPQDTVGLESLLAQLGLGGGQEGRIRLDSGSVRTPSKLLVTDANAPPPKWTPDDPNSAQAVANESFATWTGDPLALECGDPKKNSLTVDPALELALSISFDLPQDIAHSKDDREAYTPPRLEFGRGYRLGMRAVYLGGVTLPLERAAARYELTRGGNLTLPAKGSNGHRFLRHEPIDSPLVTMAERVIKVGRHPDMPWDPTETAIVRTGKDTRLGPRTTWRVVVPPAVPMEFAVLHRLKNWSRTVGDPRFGGRRLVDGLVNVAVDPDKGGFPSRNRLSDDENKPPYDALFKVKPTPDAELARRHVPYYPDPAARQLVVELVTRRTNAELKDRAVVRLDDVDAGVRYPDYLPVVLEVVALDDAAERKRKHILRYDPEFDDGVLNRGGEFVAQPRRIWRAWNQSDGTVRARRVLVQLARGEDFDIRLWCAPLPEDAARWFEPLDKMIRNLQLIGRVIQNVSKSASPLIGPMLDAFGLRGNSLPDDIAVLEGLIALMGPGRADDLRKKLGKSRGGKTPPQYADVARLDGVSFPLMRAVAEMASERSLEVPVPGFSNSRTIRVMHAIQQPRYAPCFAPLTGTPEAVCEDTAVGEKLIAVVRKEFRDTTGGPTSAGTPSGAGTSNNPTRADWLTQNPDPSDWSGLPHQGHDEGASDTAFGGRLVVDLDTTSQIAVWAQAAIVVDDVSRKRNRSQPPPPPEKMRDIYGFKVDLEGDVDFGGIDSSDIHSPSNSVELIELLRTRDLSDEIADEQVDNREILDLAFAPGDAVREFERRYRFTKPTARKLHLQLEARSRFEHFLIRQAAPGAEGPRLPDPLMQPGAKTTFWLPATKRPDPIDRKSLLPAFVWTEKAGGTDIERRTLVRIRMKRPWFSSGEGERLGIVLWPPEILDPSRRDEIARDIARDPIKSTGDHVVYRQYGAFDDSTATFDDSDLGPGGQFVTRWGNDPIRRGPVQTGWFMPLEAFRDAFPDSRNPTGRTVRDAQMPVPRGDNDGTSPTTPPGTPTTMIVSLLTYAPKFDVVDELWYVDAEISPLALAYPFVRLGLVRYQRHAPPEWQVSEPIVEYIQLLPRRHVIVTVEPRSATTKGHPVRVDVYGPGSDLVALRDEDVATAGSKEDYLHRPVLKARVLRAAEGAMAYSGRPGDPIVPEITAVGPDGKLLKWSSASDGGGFQPRRGEDGLEWSVRFVLKDNPKEVLHHIFLEEVEWMLPTETQTETRRQGRPNASDSIVSETGPRFALKIRVG